MPTLGGSGNNSNGPRYVGRDGSVTDRKPLMRTIGDFFRSIIDFIALFFSAITNPPQRIESRSTYGMRNRGQSGGSSGRGNGSNIRGVKRLGDASARMGG